MNDATHLRDMGTRDAGTFNLSCFQRDRLNVPVSLQRDRLNVPVSLKVCPAILYKLLLGYADS